MNTHRLKTNRSMTNRWREGGVLLALTAAFAATTMPWSRVDAKPAKGGIAWQKTMSSALKEAKRTGKPIMVDFHATWCGPCKMLDAQTFSNAAVIKESRRWVAVKVDGDKEPALVKKYQVRGFPTVAFLKPDGTIAGGFEGFQDAPATVKMMKATHPKASGKKRITA